MALNSMGKHLSVDDVARTLQIDPVFGIGLFDLAAYPVANGYLVDLFAWDARHFPHHWRTSMPADILSELSQAGRPKWHGALASVLQAGARFFPRPPSTSDIKKRLIAGEQAVMYVDTSTLYERSEGPAGHYVLVRSINTKTVTVLDPHWEFGGVHRYEHDAFLFAFYSVGAYCLFIKPR